MRAKENATVPSSIVLSVKLDKDEDFSDAPIVVGAWSKLLVEEIAGNQNDILEDVDIYWGAGYYIAKGKGVVTLPPTPKQMVFNEEAQELVVAGDGTSTMVYKVGSGAWSTAIPTASEVGVYEVQYKCQADDLYEESPVGTVTSYIAEKQVHNPTIILSPSSFTYTGNACVPTVVVKDGDRVIPADEYTLEITSNVNAGTASVRVIDNTGGDYDVMGETTFEIAKATPTVTAPTAKTLTYNGESQVLANAGATDFGTLQYSLNNENWGTEIPSATNAGSYTLYYRVVGDENINDVAAQTVACSVSKIAPTYTAPTGKENLEYTGEAQELLNAGSTNDGTIKYSLDGTNWGTSVPTGTEAQTYTVYWKLEGDVNHNDVAQSTISVEIASVAPAIQAVDLGLPSGKLWANMNLGAQSETDAGLYFAWGETTGYTDAAARNTALGRSDGFSSEAYTATGGAAITDNILSIAHDAAHAYMGADWRMPEKEDFQELYDNTDNVWTSINDVYGRKFMKKSDHTVYIFLPFAKHYNGTYIENNISRYWSSNKNNSENSYAFVFTSENVWPQNQYAERRRGCSIRAVRDAV